MIFQDIQDNFDLEVEAKSCFILFNHILSGERQ